MGYLFAFFKRSIAREKKMRELKAPKVILDNERRIQMRLVERLLKATVEYEKKNGIKPPDRSGE
jgi:hypothetical protein